MRANAVIVSLVTLAAITGSMLLVGDARAEVKGPRRPTTPTVKAPRAPSKPERPVASGAAAKRPSKLLKLAKLGLKLPAFLTPGRPSKPAPKPTPVALAPSVSLPAAAAAARTAPRRGPGLTGPSAPAAPRKVSKAPVVTKASAAKTKPAASAPAKPTLSKPAGPQLPLKLGVPFPCGVKVRVNCGYGPACSPAHRGHDHYALDLSRRQAGSGRGLAVVAAAGGVVTYAGWALGRWRYYGKIVVVDHGVRYRGKPLQTLYAHLRSVSVRVGQRVDRSTELGTLGGSSRGELRRLGAHLHFAILAGSGSLASRRSLLPEPLGRYRNLRRGSVLVACQRVPTP
jgi:murein DD-endopeptidase MepM/ murein hydrolase activator NlpD